MRIVSLFANIGVAEACLNQLEGANVVVANELLTRRAKLYQRIYPETEMICGDITDETVTFKIGMWDYESVYIQYFICKVPLSDIPKLLDNKKSIWKYNPDTDVHYF